METHSTYSWERNDTRVSKHVFHITFSFSEAGTITVTNNHLGTKLCIAFHLVAGAKKNTSTAIHTIALLYLSPIEVKEKVGKEWCSRQLSSEDGIQRLSLRLIEDKYDLDGSENECKKSKYLNSAFQNGFFSSGEFPKFDKTNLITDPTERFPILVHPTLVRAVQKADIGCVFTRTV